MKLAKNYKMVEYKANLGYVTFFTLKKAQNFGVWKMAENYDVVVIGSGPGGYAAARALIGSTEKFTEISFPHPTVSEVLKEAWEDAFDMSLHMPPKTAM